MRTGNRNPTITANRARDVPRAWSKYYDLLARHFLAQARVKPSTVILEAGCGSGQLTIPLLKRLPKSVKFFAVDSSIGPYLGWLDKLSSRLESSNLDSRVRSIWSDIRRIREVDDEAVDVIVSNELLCDLPRKDQLRKALGEFDRILRPNGMMIHGEWSSHPTIDGQGFKVRHSPAWNPDQLFDLVREAGFHSFRVSYFETTIHFCYEPAVEELRTWGLSERFIKHYEKSLRNHGIQLPFEHVIQCEK